MDRAPHGRTSSVGPPIKNVLIYVVDDNCNRLPMARPVRSSSPGCVWPRVHNDPNARSARSCKILFARVSACTGAAIYGRGLPDGKLEFLGGVTRRSRSAASD